MDNSTLCEGVCTEVPRPWEEEEVWGSFRRWHVLLLTSLAGLSVTMFFCCVFKCRVPRTKQEIEANYIRRQLARKFRRQLNIINNSEMDEMDLLKALERLRAELRADSGSLAQSEAFSTLSFTPTGTPTYRKGSELHIGVSLEELRLATAEGPITNLKGRVSNIITGALHKLKR
ncbi:uncharacterized protein LOC121873721 isoform X1 [Homarus americanus]|uniref:uncharacterized protein LOC121873721 isoform X1 n=1 Tax=Homarus americanus TaxID=6706 RepID=UPI001C494F31|nr:uncharacterized protein LOC121873721 isoform X1 [Homarus americanus]XP_042233357.1 uncharacterized protein LOC121873721 isoform X1 [Homarus americanus]